MILQIATALVQLAGIAISVSCIAGGFAPQRLFDIVADTMRTKRGLAMAVGVRVLLGVSLIVAGPVSRFPNVLWVLGVVSLLAAAAIPCLGRRRLSAFVSRFRSQPLVAVRIWLVLGFGFGAFLIYAVS